MQTLVQRIGPLLFIAVSAAGFWYAGARSLEPGAGRVEVSWLIPVNDMKSSYEELAAGFRERHPGIDLRMIWVPGNQYQTKFKTLAAAGDAPDVFYTGDVWVAYMLPFLRDMTFYFERDREEIDLDDFFPEVIAAMQHKGRFYFLAVHINVSMLYYNRKLFDEAGVSYPTPDWTWDDFFRAGEAISRVREDGARIWGSDISTSWWGEWLIYVRQAGGSMFNEDMTRCLLDSPEAIRGVQFYHDKVTSGISPRPGYGPVTRFASGRMGLVYGGHTTFWRIYNRAEDLDWDVALLPKGPVRRHGGEIAVGAFAVTKDCRHPEAAWELVKHLASREGVIAEVRAGGLPSRRSVARELMLGPDRLNDRPPSVEWAFEQIKYSMTIPRSPDYIEIAIEVIQPEIDRMLQGELTPEQACRRAAEAANRFIETLGRRDR